MMAPTTKPRQACAHHCEENRPSECRTRAPTIPPRTASHTRYHGNAGNVTLDSALGNPVDSAITVARPDLAAVQVTISLQEEFAAIGTIPFENCPAGESTTFRPSAATVSTPASSSRQTCTVTVLEPLASTCGTPREIRS